MLSFWPSFSLLVFFLVILLECRAIAGRVTLSLGGFLMVFCYGAIGAPLFALLLQQVLTPSEASADSMGLMAWLIAPPIEELAKALPVILLAFLTREARRLSIADLALMGFASGAGFGFVEGNLNAIVNGTLPGLTNLAALGLQTENGGVFFAGHAVSTALVGLAAGIGLRFLPLKVVYAWAPAAFVVLWASFDHGIYNWKLLNADSAGALPNAHFVVELLHAATLKGQLATWLLPLGLIVAQIFEAYLCSKAVGARRDLLLAREWRPWVVNEWLVAILRAPLGRAAFGQTLAYFRLRRAFYLASFEARRDPGDPTWTRHARALEERLKRERSILFDPPPGTWLLPFPVLKIYAAEWTWRMRWVLLFAVLFIFLFLLGPRSLPEWLRQILYGETFAIAMVAAGLAFAVWRIVLFIRQPRPDPLAAEGAACAGYYARALLLGCSFVCGLFPAAALLLGWKAFAPGAAFLSGYLPAWIAQGGNLQTLLGLGAIGSAVAPDPRPVGEAYRHEIAAADERIRLLALDIEDNTGTAETASPGNGRPLKLDAFLDAMAKLDAERDAQARRQLVLDECERQAGEATITDPAPAAQAVKDEFDRLATELLDAAAKELDAIASLEQAYGRAWAEIMRDLDAHDVLRRRLSVPLHAAWQAQGDTAWALRVVEATDEGLLPMQLTLLSDLQAVATGAQSTRAEMVAAGIERIREAAAQYGEEDPFAFAGAQQAVDDEAALLAEFASSAPSAEAPKAFGLRTPQPVEPPPAPADDVPATEAEPPQSEQNRIQKALDQLIDSGKSDERYLETIRHLERSTEALRQPLQPIEPAPQSAAPVESKLSDAVGQAEHKGELDDLIAAIKRDSGYLDFTTQATPSDDEHLEPEPDAATPAVDVPADDRKDTHSEPVVALGSADARVEPDVSVSVSASEEMVAALADALTVDLEQTSNDAVAFEIEAQAAVDEPVADAAPVEPAERTESDETLAAPVLELAPDPSETSAVAPVVDDVRETAPHEAPVAAELVVATSAEPIVERRELEEEAQALTPEPVAVSLSDTPSVELAQNTVDAPALDAEAPTAHETLAQALTLEPAAHREPDETLSEPAQDPATAPSDTPAFAQTTDEHETHEPEVADPESTPEMAVVVDASTPGQAGAQPFVLVAEEEPTAPADETKLATPPVALEQNEQLALPLSPARDDEKPAETAAPLRTGAFTSRTDTSGRITVKTPTAIEPTPPWEPDEPPAKAEIRSSLFTRLFQSIKRQSSESAAKRARWDEPKPLDAKPAEPVVAPRFEDQPAAPQPQTPSADTTATKADWLADFAAATREAVAEQADATSLQPIEWPALNRTADMPDAADRPAAVETHAIDDDAKTRDTAPANIEQASIAAPAVDAEPLEARASADEIIVASATDEPDSVTAAITVDATESREPEALVGDGDVASVAVTEPAVTTVVVEPDKSAEAETPVHDAAVSVFAEPSLVIEPAISFEPAEPAAAAPVASEVPASQVEKPQAADEFGSKADRLSYLLTKLEQAIQARTTAPATPSEAPIAPADATPSAPAELAADSVPPSQASEAPVVIEPKGDEAQEPAEQTAAADQPDNTASPVVEMSVAPEQPIIEVRPAADESSKQKPADAQLKPDRLSYFFNKLFETAKHEPVERPPVPRHADPVPALVAEIVPPAPAEVAPAYPAESEILDLRGPVPLPDPPDEAEPSVAAAPLSPQESVAVEEPAPASVSVIPEPVQPAPSHAQTAETAEPAPSQSEPTPAASTPDVAPYAMPAQPSAQPVAPPPRRLAEPTTHFGSRSKPPRPKSPVQGRDTHPTASAPAQVSQSAAAQRPQASAANGVAAEGETPASTPKRDWKLARSEPSKPVDAPTADATKKPDIRIKTGSGALATTDAAPLNSPAATANTPGKYYGPRLAKADDDAGANTPAQQRALGLSDALTEYYAKTGESQPPMHTTDRATLQRIITNGKLEAPKRRGAAWSTSGMSRRGEVAIRLKPGAEQFIEFVPSNEIFGQVAHYYPRGVGKGSFATHIPAGHLEYFDVTVHQWVPLLRGRE